MFQESTGFEREKSSFENDNSKDCICRPSESTCLPYENIGVFKELNHFQKPSIETWKKWWHERTSCARLKIGKKDFFCELANHPQKDSPQSIQGMWQAYGQMRAARTTGRFAVLATGVVGVGLWIYQQSISTQKKDLDRSREDLSKTTKVANAKHANLRKLFWEKAIIEGANLAATVQIREKQVNKYREHLRNVCSSHKDGQQKCFDEFEKIIANIDEEFEKASSDIKDAAEKVYKQDYEEPNTSTTSNSL